MSQEEIIIPKGWIKTTIGKEIEFAYGKGLPKPERIEGDYPVYGSNGIVGTHHEFLIDFPSIVIGRKGTVGSIHKTNAKFWPTDVSFYVKINDSKKLQLDFVFYLLHFLNLPKYSQSGPKSGLNRNDVYKIECVLPPLPTQKKIVAKLDHILGELEIKKKEILKLKEKKASGMSKLSQKTIGGMILKHMKIGDIPKNWQIKTLEDCVDIQSGFAQGEKNVANGTIHLRMNNIGRNFELNYDLTRTINATKEQLIKYKLEKDDVIFNNTNSPELVGKSVIFNDDKVCLYSNHLTRCRVNKELLLPEWLLFYIRGKWLRRDFENMCNKWINQAAFGGNKLKELKIPIPPLDEQKRILKILKNTSMQFERISNLTKAIKNRDEQNKKFIDNIQSSILDSAFTGKLLN